MWALRILSGPKQGAILPLSAGKNTIGRSSSCSVQIADSGISKNHAEIDVQEKDLVLMDSDSKNGTYVNGIQIKKQIVEIGDQISFHNVAADIVLEKQAQHLQAFQNAPGMAPPMGAPSAGPQAAPEPPVQKFSNWWNEYLNKVVLPGVYKLPEWMEFKWVIGCFSIGFIILVTLFSTIPLTRILKDSVEKESMNHAQSIAQALAVENRASLIEGLNTAVNVDYALKRPNVQSAYIIQRSTGRIIAPAEKAQTYPDNPFIHKARRLNKTTVEKINSSTVAAMVPIEYLNPDTSSQDIMAYSAVFFNLAGLSHGKEKTISLVVQSLFIALLLGVILFFLMYEMIRHPFRSVNEQLSTALKDDSAHVSISYQFPDLQNLCSNINSALERVSSSQEQAQSAQAPIDRQSEMTNLVELIGFASLCIQLDTQTIVSLNQPFEEQTGLARDQLLHQSIDQITDTSLQLNLKNIIENVSQNPSQIFTDQLEFNGNPFHITAQGVHGEAALSYILVAFIPEEGGE